jgi:CRP/FNR family transcriptional regulator/CRP/FNR family cyclic AMP-dependent transcriptional regulator
MSQASLDLAVRLLQEVPFFAGVRREDLIPLAAACRPRHFRRHQIIFHRDDPGDTLHIVQSGEVRIILTSPQGDEILLALMRPGDFFGELSLLDGLPRSATAVANETTETLTLARAGFLNVIEHTPQMAHQIILSLSARLRRTDLLLGDSAFLDVPTRLVKRLLDLAHTQAGREAPKGPVTIRVTQTELAAMVGATRESVNRELRVLEGRSLIRVERGRIEIQRPEALSAMDW